MDVTLSVTVNGVTTDITQLAATITWSGDIAQCGRVLSFGVLASPVDANIPIVAIPLGAGVVLAMDDKALFDGFVFNRQNLTGSSVMEITFYDRGIYVKRNSTTAKYKSMTPEAITKQVCDAFAIETGGLAETGMKVSRNFVGVPLYKIIQTAYTLASRVTREAYHIRFDGSALIVLKKEVSTETLLIQGGSNLVSAAVTESIDRMVSQVAIYDADDKLVHTVKNEEWIRLYGVMQEIVKQAKGEDASAKAQKMLDDNGVGQKITLNNMGDLACITGNAVAVQEPYTGLSGLFWIDSDTHTWKNGLYLNKLVLNFRRMMDEQEAGSLPVAGKKKGKEDKWSYINVK